MGRFAPYRSSILPLDQLGELAAKLDRTLPKIGGAKRDKEDSRFVADAAVQGSVSNNLLEAFERGC